MGAAKIVPDHTGFGFLPYQWRWIRDSSRLKLEEKSRQIGLSWSTAYRAVRVTSAQSAQRDQWVSSRDELQARLFIEDCKKFAQLYKIACEDKGIRVIDEEKRLSAYVLEFANGKRIHSMSSNPDAQAGKRGGRILDEFALHPDQRKLWAIAYPGMTWGGNMEIISTHRGSNSFFNQLVREIKEKGNPKKISLHTVTLQTALDEGFLYKLQASLPKDHEVQAMDEAGYFDFIRGGCADEESFQQEYMCQPADDDAAFLEYGLIAACEYPSGETWELDCATAEREARQRELYAGMDIGRKKDLTVLWIVERLGEMLYTRKVIRLQNMSKPEQEKELWPWLRLVRRACIDYTSLGIGWGDDAAAEFGASKIELVTFSPRIKEELAYPIRGKMEDKRLRIPYDPKIRAGLRAVTKQVTLAGNVRFTAERTPDGHADEFWALGLAVHAASSPAAPIEYTPIPSRRDERDRDERAHDAGRAERDGGW